MKNIVLAVLLVFSVNCFADETWLDLNLHAHHWNRTDVREKNLNEVNPGIGIRFVDGDYHKMIGAYRNSHSRTSTYALLGWTPIGTESIRIGAVAGVTTGYAKPYKPAAGVFVATSITKDIGLNITLVPTIRSIPVYGFAGFQLSAKF